MKILCSRAEDRDNLVMILARNGYTVRVVREKPAGTGKAVYQYFVEIVEPGKGGDGE